MPAPAAVLQVLVTANTGQANAALAKTQAQLNATAATAEKSAAKSSAAMAGFNKGIASLARYGPMALGAFAVASVKMGADFEDAMSQISTQAGATTKEVERMKKPILELAQASEFGPTELAKGLFRVESAGIRGARAMRILKAATDLADVGHADLEQTTKAYVAAIKSGIKGTQDFNKAAGLMNAIVGQGSMRMDDLVGAFGTGLLPRAKAVGLSLDQVGAALGVLTEQGMGATQSATRLGMTFSKMVGQPTAEAADALEQLNIKQGAMARMLLEPNGLVKVLELLHDRLQKLPEAQRSATISSMFGGGRSSAAIQVLINSLDDYRTKLQGVRTESGKFSQKIAEDNKTMSSRVAASWAFLQAKMTEFGLQINNAVTKALNIGGAVKKASDHSAVLRAVFAGVSQTAKQMVNPLGAAKDAVGKLGDTFAKVKNVVGNAIGSIGDKIGWLIDKFQNLRSTVGRAASNMTGPVVTAFHAIKDAADAVVRTVTKVINVFKTAAAAPKDLLEKGLDAFGLQKGGVLVPGRGTGDRVPAMLEPGEVVWNKKAVQAAGGAQRVNQMNKAVPRFAGGGLVQGARDIATTGAGIMKVGGLGVLGALYEQAKKTGLTGGNASWATFDAFARKLGLSLTSTYRPGDSDSFHGQPMAGGRSHATDYADGPGAMAAMFRAVLPYARTGKVRELFYDPLGGWDEGRSIGAIGGHMDHVHVAIQKGGIVPGFAGGGIAGYNKSYPRGGGPAIPFNIAAAIGESVGQPGITVAQIAKGESSLHPGAVSSDGGYGLLQMTPRVQSSSTVSAWERIGSYFNPFKNVKMSKLLPMGPSTYFGSQYVTGWNQHYRGTIGKTINKPKPSAKVPKGSDPAGSGEPAWSLALPAALTNTISSLGGETGRIAEAAEFASRASEFGVPVKGKNEVQWILEELKLMEELREAYIAMILYIKQQIDKFQEAIQRAKAHIAKLKQGKKTAAKAKSIKEWQAKIGKYVTRRDISKGALTDETTGPLAGLSEMQDPVAGKMFERAVGLNLADKKLWGVFGGSVGAAQSSLKSAQELLAADTGETGGNDANAPDNSALIALLQDQANKLAQQLYVSEQSYKVLANTPYAGSFAKGGVVPGPTGAPMLATVHGGETIGNGSPVVVVVVEDGAVDARRIRAIAGKQAEQMARRAGRGRIPGRAGSMT